MCNKIVEIKWERENFGKKIFCCKEKEFFMMGKKFHVVGKVIHVCNMTGVSIIFLGI